MSYKLADDVLARIVQIIQEGIIMGVDVVDIMRQIEVQPSSDESCVVLTESYLKSVNEMHKKLLDEAENLKVKNSQNPEELGVRKFIINWGKNAKRSTWEYVGTAR